MITSPRNGKDDGTVEVGDFIAPTKYELYIREQIIYFYATGMRPGALVHAFFDGNRVSERIIPGTISNTALITPTVAGESYITLSSTTIAQRMSLSLADQRLTVANNGTVAGLFYLEGNRYKVGNRDFVLADVTQLASVSDATTYARKVFYALHTNVLNSSTRPPEMSFGSSLSDGVTTGQGASTRSMVLSNSNTNATASNVSITLFTGTGYSGTSRTFTGACLDLTYAGAANGVTKWDSYPNRIVVRSIQITPGSEWMIYQGRNRANNKIKISANTTDIEGATVRLGGLTGFEPVTLPTTHTPTVTTPSDPISQTFTVAPELIGSQDGVFISSIDIFFKTKDPTHGVSVELRETVNGYPSNVVLPFGKKTVASANVNTSTTGATATNFKFDNLVYLKAGTEYCFCVIPDGCSPEYQIFTAVTGGTDLVSGTVVRQDWGTGKMFQATNNSNWVPLGDEDIKFTLKRAVFATGGTGGGGLSGGHALVQNKDYEFFTLTTSDGKFLVGERVFKVVANLTGSINTSSSNLTVKGNSTLFQTELAIGDYLTVPDSNSAPTTWDLVKVTAIASNTSLTVERYPLYTVLQANTSRPPTGVVTYFDSANLELVLVDSTAANSTFLFANTNVVWGSQSGANATINVVTNKIMNYFQPLISRFNASGTTVDFEFRTIDTAYTESSYVSGGFETTNYLTDKESMIASRSNEIVNNSGEKSFMANLIFSSNNTLLSSFIDLQNMAILVYKNKISNTNTNEYTSYGSANSKHVSTTVFLGANQEAEDMVLYLTAFRPANTDIEVYAKILNAADPERFDTKAWSKLDKITSNNLYSDSSNIQNVVELQYGFPNGPVVNAAANGFANVSNASAVIVGTSTVWELGSGVNVLTANDYIKISDPNDATVYDVQRVVTVTDNTHITVGSNVSFNSTGAIINKVAQPSTAFLYGPNDKVVRYFNTVGSAFDGYRTFALKIVLLADSTNLVPRVSDVRCISLSV